jgi:hypothetical protein
MWIGVPIAGGFDQAAMVTTWRATGICRSLLRILAP